jgi:Uma2 family endonuclease
MATTFKRLTYDDLESIPQERPGDRHELIDGNLFVTPVPFTAHQEVSANITYRLGCHVRDGDLGSVLCAPVNIRFTPDNVLFPDLLFIRKDRLHVIGPMSIDAPPDLVIEIVSPETHARDVGLKQSLYARFGVQEYWIVDPGSRTVAVLSLGGDRYWAVPLGEVGSLQSRVLPGLDFCEEEVFAGLREF